MIILSIKYYLRKIFENIKYLILTIKYKDLHFLYLLLKYWVLKLLRRNGRFRSLLFEKLKKH